MFLSIKRKLTTIFLQAHKLKLQKPAKNRNISKISYISIPDSYIYVKKRTA